MMRFAISLASLALLSACRVGGGGGSVQQQPQQQSAADEPAAAHQKHRNRHKQPRTGAASNDAKFDFYVLSLSWSPQHCATAANTRPGDMECGQGRLYDFVLHGMWPQYEKGWPQDCSTEPVPRAIVDGMLDIMPSPGLVRHEWTKHGTCSGLEPGDYFEEARKAYKSVRIPDQYRRPKLQVMARPDEMKTRFVQANQSIPADGLVVLCSGRYLQEVRVCLTTDFEPRACNKEVLRDQCRVDEMIMRPVR